MSGAARALAVVASVAAMTWPGCSRPEEAAPPRPPHVVLVTQVPARAKSEGVSPFTRYPDGSRIVRLDLAHPDAAPLDLTEGLAAAGGASVRADGARVVFVAKKHEDDAFAVWTCATDGSERKRSLEGAADCGSAAFLGDGRIVFSAATAPGVSELFVTDAAGGAPQRITFSGGVAVDPSALRDGRVVFSSRAQSGAASSLLSVHVDGTGVAPYCGTALCRGEAPAAGTSIAVPSDPAWRAIQCVDLAPRARPQGHLSVVDPSKGWGGVLCIDARTPGAAPARRVRVVALEPAEHAIGEVPLESDGSFYVRVPPDAPLALDLVDAEGRVVAGQRTPFWVRPGETRCCIGCHEEPDTTPPNVRPLAVLDEPVALGVAESLR